MHNAPFLRRSARGALLVGTALAGFTGLAARAAEPASDSLEEVVITAQKRTERLSDTTVSGTVLNSDALENAGITDIADISKVVPSVELAGTFNGRVPLGIRGVQSDSDEAAIGISSGVGIEIDGIPVPSDSFAANEVEDIVGIEVLEGPQATLGGRTATSGIINYITHKPTNYWTGSTADTFTNDGEQHLTGTLSGPIADHVSFTATGWDHYTEFPIKNLTTDQYAKDDSYGLRDKVKVELSDDFDATLMTRLSANRSHGQNFVYTYVTPGAYILGGLSGGPPFWSQAALFPSSIHLDANNTQVASPVTGMGEIRYDADASLDLEWRLGGYTLSSLTAFQHETRRSSQDLFSVNDYFGNLAAEFLGAPLSFDNLQTQYVNTRETSEEIKLASPAEDRLTYVAGLFYSDTRTQLHQIRDFLPALLNSQITPETATYDAYGHGSYKILDNTTLTGGLRFNYDALKYDIDQFAYNPGSGPVTDITSSGSSSSSAVVGDIGVKQQVTPTAQVYLTYTRGYAPEVYNTALYLSSSGQSLTPVGQEKINSFEFGTKGRYFDGSLEVDGALFDTIYDNYQIQTYLNVAGAAIGQINLSAAGQAETRGAELNMRWKPWSRAHVEFNAAYTDAVFNSYKGGPCWWAGSSAASYPNSCYYDASSNVWRSDLSGKGMPNAPKIKLHLSAEQSWSLKPLPYDLSLGGDVSYRSRAQMLADQNPYSVENAYAILNLHATVMQAEGDYAVTVFVNNLTNTHYDVFFMDSWNSPWGSNAVVRQPARDTDRFYGVRFNAAF